MTVAAGVAAVFLAIIAVFQLALAFGAPWGKAAWGGRIEGVLPARLRIASGVVAILVYPQHRNQKLRNKTRGDGRVRVNVALDIPARPEVVFAYLSHLENNPQWNWAVTHTSPLDRRSGKGARYRQERAWPRAGRNHLEVTVYHPPSLLEVVAEDSEAGRVRYRYRLRLKAVPPPGSKSASSCNPPTPFRETTCTGHESLPQSLPIWRT